MRAVPVSSREMKILVSGPNGLIGARLVSRLSGEGHDVIPLSRAPGPGRIGWDPAAGRLDTSAMSGLDGIIHLAGESIAGGRWTGARREAIRRSRVDGTRLLARAAAALRPRPSFFLLASAQGFYGDRGDTPVDETASPGSGFLADVCREWEAAADPARQAGIRTVPLRIGLVLTPEGGALRQMLLPFRLGLGAPLGSGRQYWSWITLDDLLGAFDHLIRTATLEGPVNGVTGAVTNRDFTRALAAALGRWTIPAVPRPLLRLLLGEMADALLLTSTRSVPRLLTESGFRWSDPELAPALRRLLHAGSRAC